MDEQYITDQSYFIEWLELIAQTNETISLHFEVLSRLPIGSCPRMIHLIRSIGDDADSDTLCGIACFMEFVAAEHFEVFSDIFSLPLVLLIADRTSSFERVATALVKLLQQKQPIEFLTNLLACVLKRCFRSDPQYFQTMAVLVMMLAKQIPADTYERVFEQVFRESGGVAVQYARVLSGKGEYDKEADELTKQFYEYIRNGRRPHAVL